MRTAFAAVLPAVLLAAAFAAPASAETKIGVISVPVLLRDAPQVRSANDKFKAEFQKREDDIKADVKKLQDDVKKYQRDVDTMSAQQRTTAQNDLNSRKTALEGKQRNFTEQAQARNDELQREVLDKINQAIVEVSKEKGLDLVVRDPAYASAALDITADVMKKLEGLQGAPAAESKKKK
jgi:outer membrane protein